jgi:ADP-dependent phosphofructokinase/glucokinase
MPLLIQAELERKLRWWFYRLASTSPPDKPTEKPILSLFVSTVDRIIRLDNNLIHWAIELAAQYDECPQDDVINALCNIINGSHIPWGRPATTATHVLEALIARIIHQSQADDRVRIDPDAGQVLDFLNEWFQCQSPDQQPEQPGGAPAIIAEMLTQLGEQNVGLWTAYHSQKQASVFDPEVKFLAIDDQCNHVVRRIHNVGRSEDPEIRNYPMEFAKGTEFEFKQSDGSTCSISASASDRVIAISPGYRYFDPSSGRVHTGNIPLDIAHILVANPHQGPTCASQVAQDYKYWIVSGLHKANEANQQTLESDLQQVPPDVTIHVEISGPNISRWFQRVLRQYVNSVGVNADDLERLVQKVSSNEPPNASPPYRPNTPDLQEEYLLRLALWLACELNLERVYVHGLKLDYIVRRHASDDEMDQEVRADLLAKLVVTNRARDVGISDRPARVLGMPVSNLETFIELCSLRSFPLQEGRGWATLEGLPEFEHILDRGWFDDRFECQGRFVDFRVAVIPVALFRLDPVVLKFVGAGDTTSAVSFLFGCFTTRGLKRRQYVLYVTNAPDRV